MFSGLCSPICNAALFATETSRKEGSAHIVDLGKGHMHSSTMA